MTADGGTRPAALDDEVVALGLTTDGFVDGIREKRIAFRGAQWRPQIGGIFLAETHEQRSGAGHPHAIAAFAEIMREGGDEAESAARLAHFHIPRRTAGLVGDVRHGEAL